MGPEPDGTWRELSEQTLTTFQVRNVDRVAIEQYGMNSLVLMENAALGCVRRIARRHATPGLAVILCGSGNNGGDGLVIARHLDSLGWRCSVALHGPEHKLTPDNRANLEILKKSIAIFPEPRLNLGVFDAGKPPGPDGPAEPVTWLRLHSENPDGGTCIVIDAMLGTAAHGEPRSPYREWIAAANEMSGERIAIDIPTGVDAESGEHGECYFAADTTLTFVAKKPAMSNPKKQHLFGEIEVLPIGTPSGLNRQILAEL